MRWFINQTSCSRQLVTGQKTPPGLWLLNSSLMKGLQERSAGRLRRKPASFKGVLHGSSEKNILHSPKNSPTIKCTKDEETHLGHDRGEKSFAAIVGLQRIF